MSAFTWIRSVINRYFGSCDYRIWQCKADRPADAYASNVCQRLRGHSGRHRDWEDHEWETSR